MRMENIVQDEDFNVSGTELFGETVYFGSRWRDRKRAKQQADQRAARMNEYAAIQKEQAAKAQADAAQAATLAAKVKAEQAAAAAALEAEALPAKRAAEAAAAAQQQQMQQQQAQQQMEQQRMQQQMAMQQMQQQMQQQAQQPMYAPPMVQEVPAQEEQEAPESVEGLGFEMQKNLPWIVAAAGAWFLFFTKRGKRLLKGR